MTKEENIRAILECNFTGYKDEIINNAVKRIMELKHKSEKCLYYDSEAETCRRSIIEEGIKEDICDNYCKYPSYCSEEELTEKCQNCPLG